MFHIHAQGRVYHLGKLNAPGLAFLPVGPGVFRKRRNSNVRLGVNCNLCFPTSVIVQGSIKPRAYLYVYCTTLMTRQLPNEQRPEAPVKDHKWRPGLTRVPAVDGNYLAG